MPLDPDYHFVEVNGERYRLNRRDSGLYMKDWQCCAILDLSRVSISVITASKDKVTLQNPVECLTDSVSFKNCKTLGLRVGRHLLCITGIQLIDDCFIRQLHHEGSVFYSRAKDRVGDYAIRRVILETRAGADPRDQRPPNNLSKTVRARARKLRA